MSDLLDNTKFSKLTSVTNLHLAEAIKKEMTDNKIAAVIINDEEPQVPKGKTKEKVKPLEPYRIEVPEQFINQARGVLNDFYDRLSNQ